ncbi:hypothetical protein VCH24_17330 [Variovorax boronicumulans]|nr:hypothetical protein VCH24_17330 [Variovorax boronicumulans]
MEPRVAAHIPGTAPTATTAALAVQPNTDLAVGPMAQAMQALKMGLSLADMRELLALQKEHEANEARKAYVADMAAYKLNPPQILKDKTVFFESAKGVTTYDHATLGAVCEQIISTAAAHGFSHRWVPSPAPDGKHAITCVITHRLGHSEETRLEGPRDDTGNKNPLQAVQSTNTFLSRYSLLMSFGFAPKDQPDDDGASAAAFDAAAKTGAPEGDPTENDMTREWCAKVSACKSLDTMRGIRRAACKAFADAQDLGRWTYFRDWVDGKIADMAGQAG